MTKLYRLRDRVVREVDKKDEVRLRCLLRAGFVVGNLPPLPKPKPPVEEKPLPPTEGEEEDSGLEGKVVLAEHEPVATPTTPLQEVQGEEAEVDDVDDDALTEALTGSDEEEAHDPDADVAEDATEEDDTVELPEGDGELPEVTVTVDGVEVEGFS